MQEQLSVTEALRKLSGALQNYIVECGIECGIAMADGRVEDYNAIQWTMCGVASYREHFQHVGEEMMRFQADPATTHASVPMTFVVDRVQHEPAASVQAAMLQEQKQEQKQELMPVAEEENATLLTAAQLGRTELVQELITPKRRGRRPQSVSEEELGPKSARMRAKPGEHTSKSAARRGLVAGSYTQAREYEPWLLRAMLDLGGGEGFSKIQHEMRDLMTEMGVIRQLDLEMTGTHTPRYQAQTSSLRNSMERRGLIQRNASNKWELTHAGKELAEDHHLEYNQPPAQDVMPRVEMEIAAY